MQLVQDCRIMTRAIQKLRIFYSEHIWWPNYIQKCCGRCFQTFSLISELLRLSGGHLFAFPSSGPRGSKHNNIGKRDFRNRLYFIRSTFDGQNSFRKIVERVFNCFQSSPCAWDSLGCIYSLLKCRSDRFQLLWRMIIFATSETNRSITCEVGTGVTRAHDASCWWCRDVTTRSER